MLMATGLRLRNVVLRVVLRKCHWVEVVDIDPRPLSSCLYPYSHHSVHFKTVSVLSARALLAGGFLLSIWLVL